MHKVRNQIKKAAFALGMVLTFGSALAFGQVRIEEPKLLDIQQAYQRGEIDVDRAVLEQFRILYEPSDTDIRQNPVEKCGTPISMFLHRHSHEISEKTKSKIEEYRSGKVISQDMLAEERYISPSGKFEIIYQTSGQNSVPLEDNDDDYGRNGIPDYVDRVAASADSSYRHLVMNIGYPDPIPSGTRYRIEVENLVFYGETRPNSAEPSGTYIRIENDFAGFPPNSHPEGDVVGAIYATMAHEFKHAIQYIQNNWSGENDLWAEMDATLVEEVVYDDVNDYYNYIDNFSTDLFSSPSTSLIPGSYEDITWALFFEEYIGPDFWVEVWERIEAQPSILFLDAVENELNLLGYDFDEEVVRSYMWHFVSGDLTGRDDYGFEEKNAYPTPQLDHSYPSVPNGELHMGELARISSRYFEITPAANDNGLVEIAVDFDSSQVGVGLIAYLKTGETKEIISTGRDKAQVYVPTNFIWSEIDRLGVVITNFDTEVKSDNLFFTVGKSGQVVTIRDPKFTDLPEQIAAYQNYPNPFNPETKITFDLPISAYVRLEVFDIMGRKVGTLVDEFRRLGNYTETFNAGRLSSGVYLYRLRIDQKVFIKKMILVK
jgi:hypothetical protein